MGAMFEHLHVARAQLTAPGSPFEVTTIDVRGVPTKVFASAPPTMRSIFELSAAFADRDYIVYEDERYTYGEIHAQVRALAHALVTQHGVGSGDRVALAMRNYPEWVVGYWATVSIGAAVVGMNAWWTPVEMAYGLNDSRPKVLIADDERLERARRGAGQRADARHRRAKRARPAHRLVTLERPRARRQRTRLAPGSDNRSR
jgi:long-chain acyl-CoA synthetase